MEAVAAKQWAKDWPCCRRCRTKRRRHSGQGYCTKCHPLMLRRGRIQTVKKRLQVRGGSQGLEYRCTQCERWLPRDAFGKSTKKQRVPTPCKDCRREYLEANRENLSRRHREWWAGLQEANRAGKEADMKDGRADPLGKARIRVEVLRDALDSIALTFPDDAPRVQMLAIETRTYERAIWQIYSGRVDDMKFDTAEKILLAAGWGNKIDELLDLPGREEWGPRGARYCARCGSSNRPHRGRGYCMRCYSSVRRYERLGKPIRPVIEERWALFHESCVRCGKTDTKHVLRGLCSRCYGRMCRLAEKRGMRVSVMLDEMGYHRSVDWGTAGKLQGFAKPA